MPTLKPILSVFSEPPPGKITGLGPGGDMHDLNNISKNSMYNHPEVDRIHGGYKENLRVLSKIIFYLLQDGCSIYSRMVVVTRPQQSE